MLLRKVYLEELEELLANVGDELDMLVNKRGCEYLSLNFLCLFYILELI